MDCSGQLAHAAGADVGQATRKNSAANAKIQYSCPSFAHFGAKDWPEWLTGVTDEMANLRSVLNSSAIRLCYHQQQLGSEQWRFMDQQPQSRAFARRRVLKQGKIILQPPNGMVDIIVRDAGQGGVKFEIASSTELPSKFQLIMVTDGTITPVEIKWRRGNLVGVQFCGETKNIGLRKT